MTEDEWDGVERRQERREADARMLNIERTVIKLEADMSIMTNAITQMSASVTKLVDLKQDFHDLKKDYDYSIIDMTREIEAIKEKMVDLSALHFFAAHPRLTWLMLIGIYALTIKEFRDVVLTALRFI